ncbi:MAG: hypothetical protein IJ711_12780, partial [Lachnospiraceae bacterium]|nr:hypothetical protein [Lachnospiraceae bacterium]
GEDCSLLVTEIDGVKAKFTSNTAVTGEIAEGSKGLAIDIEYDVYANEAYWDYVNMLREAEKTEEFLDIAIYLKDTEGNRVSLPPGTNAIFNEESSVPVDNGAIIYFYKDSRLGDGKDRYSLLKVDGNRTVTGTLNLNFDTADFTEFQDGTYTIYLELLKTKERDFPMGGDRLDLFQSNLTTRTIRQLGFSLETKDLITLGMNGYLPQETDQGIIDFDMFIDFSDYVPKTIFSNRTAFEELAQKYFTVDYQVLRKQQRADGSYEYVPYTGDAVQVFWGDSDSGMTQSGKTVVFKFSKNTMEKGNRGLSTLTSNDSVVTYPYTLKVDVDKLLERNDQITNYRLQGNIYISDTPPAGVTGMPAPENDVDAYQFASATPSGESLKDFIVFTIAKIKTDLDVTGTGN